HRRDQDVRPQRQRRGGGRPPDRRNGAEHGYRGHRQLDRQPPRFYPGPRITHQNGEGRVRRPTGGTPMAQRGKKYQDVVKLVDREQLYSPEEAAELAKQTTTVAFDATIEAHLKLG